MYDITFKYKKTEKIIKCHFDDKIIDVCKKFTEQINTDLETKIITFNDNKIRLNSEETFSDIILMNGTSQSFGCKPENYEIKLIDDTDKLYKVIIDYKGQKKFINVNRDDNLKNVLEQSKINFNNAFFLKGGDQLNKDDLNRRISLIANKDDKENKKMTIIAYENENEFEENENEEAQNNLENKIDNNPNENVIILPPNEYVIIVPPNPNENAIIVPNNPNENAIIIPNNPNENNNINEDENNNSNENNNNTDEDENNNSNDNNNSNENNNENRNNNSNENYNINENRNNNYSSSIEDRNNNRNKNEEHNNYNHNESNYNENLLNENKNNEIDDYTREDFKITYIVLIIQLGIIITLFWLGYAFDINEAFIKNIWTILGTFIPTIIVLSIIVDVFILRCIDNDHYIWEIIFVILYTAFMIFYCFLLTEFTSFKYILSVLFIFLFNYIVMELYFIKTANIYLMILPHLLTNSIILILFYYIWIKNINIIINMSIILFVFILYMVVMNIIIIKTGNFEIDKKVLLLNYVIFAPLGFLLYVIYISFEYCYQKCCKSSN